ncbi:MAG: motility protein A [Phycisphaeraceae bacterium]|nr:motility protein A [Phycisphaeraceae bacterium]
MDLGLIFGLIGTWLLLTWALVSGGDPLYFLNVPSLILVIGASTCVIVYSVPIRYIKDIVRVTRKALFPSGQSVEQLIEDLVSYAEVARRDGILSLENATKDIDDKFIVNGIQMAVDGTDPELIEQIMTTELDNLIERHDVGKALYEQIGKYAPAFGMIGTLVGLVVMLANMDDPSKIGPGMAVALLTTFYGALIANAFALPMADRLARRSSEEVLLKTIVIKGVMAIQSGDNPRIVEQKLRTFLPPSKRKVESEAA